jgi:hypothetical protein
MLRPGVTHWRLRAEAQALYITGLVHGKKNTGSPSPFSWHERETGHGTAQREGQKEQLGPSRCGEPFETPEQPGTKYTAKKLRPMKYRHMYPYATVCRTSKLPMRRHNETQ